MAEKDVYTFDEALAFFNEYGINNPVPDFGVEPEVYHRKDVPYILLVRYDLSKLNDKQATIFGQKLFDYSEKILNNFQLVEKEVYSDGKCYIKNFKEDSFYNILILAKDDEKEEDIILIFDAKNVINKGFLQEKEEIKPYSGPMYTCPPEEAFDELDQMDEDDDEEEEFFMISKKKKQEGPFGRDPLDDVKGKPPVDYKIPDPLDDVKTLENLKHTNVGKEEKNMHAIRIKTRKAPENYDLGASIMLGSPVLPKGMQDEIPSTAMFLMQIRLEDIKDLDEENLLPHKGYLYFFLDTEDGVYDLKPIVKYSEKEPEEYVDEWNKIVEGFEQFNEPFLIEFEKCDESDDGNKLLGCPGDWQFSETPDRLLFQLDPMGDEKLGLFPTLDGYMYFFFADNPRDFDNVKFVEDFS